MLTYSIKLMTVDDFRNYANMIYRFHIGGYVLINDRKTHISSFLEIMSHCPHEHLTMVLDLYRKNEISGLETYMKEFGLLASGKLHAA